MLLFLVISAPNTSKKSILSPNNTHLSYLNKSLKKPTNAKAKGKRKRKAGSTSKNTSEGKFKSKYEVKIADVKKKSPNQSKNVSFDMSAQIEDIFVEEFLEPLEPPKKKRVSWGDVTEHRNDENPPSKIAKLEDALKVENPPKSSENDEKFNESEKDIFSDSFANVIEELDKMEANQTVNRSKTDANRSCPKTPGYAICSEKLEFENDSITDSFLEKAFKSHLTEFESKIETSPALTTSPMRSQRLKERRKQVKEKQSTCPTVSPGLIFSDSEPEPDVSL